MTGRWENTEGKYNIGYIKISNGNILWLRDPSQNSTFKVIQNPTLLQYKLDNLGLDILSEDFTFKKLKNKILQNGNINITIFLMDQKIIAGCDNILKSEILYYAKLSPFRSTIKLNTEEIENLFTALLIIPRILYNNEKNHMITENKIYGQQFAKRIKTPDNRITYWDPLSQF